MFIDLKQSILKEIALKLESKKLMTDSLKIFFFDEMCQGVDHRQMTDTGVLHSEHVVRVGQSNQKGKNKASGNGTSEASGNGTSEASGNGTSKAGELLYEAGS